MLSQSLMPAHLCRIPARQSPDAFIQMALQLAWYRTRGTVTATYETALTRLFHHGRTETIRSLSSDSQAFVLAMGDMSTTVSGFSRLLRCQLLNLIPPCRLRCVALYLNALFKRTRT